MLERSRAALDHAKRARDELAAWCSEKLDTAAVRTTTGLSIGMDPESTKRRDDFLYRFRSAVGLLMAVGPTIDDELGPAGQKGWWEAMLQPHSKNLMKLRDLTLKHTNPPASVKHDLQGQLLEVRAWTRGAQPRPGTRRPIAGWIDSRPSALRWSTGRRTPWWNRAHAMN